MTLDPTLVRAIAEAVEHQGGDYSDVQDLIAVWQRVARRNDERAALVRAQGRRLTTGMES